MQVFYAAVRRVFLVVELRTLGVFEFLGPSGLVNFLVVSQARRRILSGPFNIAIGWGWSRSVPAGAIPW